MQDLSSLLVNVSFTSNEDTWSWNADPQKPFSVAVVKRLIKEGSKQ